MYDSAIRRALILFTPSVTSSTIGFCFGLLAFAYVCKVILAKDAFLSLLYSEHSVKVSHEIEILSRMANNSNVMAQLSVFLVWFSVGVLSIVIIDTIRRIVRQGYEFEQEVIRSGSLRSRVMMLCRGLEISGVRITGLGLIVLTYYLFKYSLPHVIAYIYFTNITDIIALALGMAVIILLVSFYTYLITIGLRLLLCRSRVWWYKGVS